MINFKRVKKISVPEGSVRKIYFGNMLLWSDGYENLVSKSIDTDGSIFNGVGYKDGYRLSSSGGVSALAVSTVTGFIPCKAGDIIRFKNVLWLNNETVTINGVSTNPTYHAYVTVYDSAFAKISYSHNDGNNGSNGLGSVTKDEKGVYSLTVPSTLSNVKYIRISGITAVNLGGTGTGADMIVTINKEIE